LIKMNENIIIKGAREHNLKNIDVIIPRNKLVVITGLSGSGKSTLAFDTLYAEGQRRYVESLSAYARQFLGLMNKPDVDSIEGLSPAISIEQKTTSKNPRSTVGTVTEIYDYLRLLFARIGTQYCPYHHKKIQKQSPQQITQLITKEFLGKEILLLAPIIRQKKGTYEQVIKDLSLQGFSRVRVNKKIIKTTDTLSLQRYQKHDIEIVMDKLTIGEDNSRLTEDIEKTLQQTNGLVLVVSDKKEKLYSSNYSCPECDTSFEELQPRLFSFNSPFGSCPTCFGLGVKMDFDYDLIIPNKELSIIDGAIELYGKMHQTWRSQQLSAVGNSFGFDIFTPIKKLTKKQLDVLLYGSDNPIQAKWSNGVTTNMQNGWEGIIPQTERLYKETSSEYRRREMEKFMRVSPCPDCKGKRLKPTSLAVYINKKNIIDLTELSIKKSVEWFNALSLTKKEQEIATNICKEIKERLSFLEKVGLNYLTLARTAGSLSGGEAQRIRLATQIGANLMGVMYILDEPSIGLHQRDNQKLLDTLYRLRDLGNTLIVVEHDEETILNADYVIDIGPGAGIHGGKIIAQGSPKDILNNKNSLTGDYLAKRKILTIPKKRRTSSLTIDIVDACENNLKNINVSIPTQVLTTITGVSGSGKSTLIHEILYKEVMKQLYKSTPKPGKHKEVKLNNAIDKLIIIDQSPIGKTPRSNPATYTKIFDDVRKVFSETKSAKLRGYSPGRFSFNVPGGRCEACQGDGLIKIEMNFLPDVYVVCEECKGKRYNEETLQVQYKEKNIAEVLAMSVEEAYEFFKNIPSLKRKLKTLIDVGLEYISLGQSSTTLSGGEAQRIKLTKELSKRSSGKTLYLLDEPTTGLHFHDVSKLIDVLNHLVDQKNTVVVIEHNLDIIKSSDWIIDLGPEGGDEGGQIIAEGTPEEIIKNKKSYTAKYLKPLL
jgi:excinuclease ABC subunit A